MCSREVSGNQEKHRIQQIELAENLKNIQFKKKNYFQIIIVERNYLHLLIQKNFQTSPRSGTSNLSCDPSVSWVGAQPNPGTEQPLEFCWGQV